MQELKRSKVECQSIDSWGKKECNQIWHNLKLRFKLNTYSKSTEAQHVLNAEMKTYIE